jgi:iron complex outermembrane receptor protein
MRRVLCTLAICWIGAASAARADHEPPPEEPGKTETAEEIVVKGRRTVMESQVDVTPDRSTPSAADAAELMELAPGGAVSWNGPISGQVQYRGLFGPRVGTRVGGVPLVPGSPNWMDPPLHYAPRPLLDSLEVQRGVAPVSAGADAIGGAVEARLKHGRFSEDERVRFDASIDSEGRSVDRAWNTGGLLSVANHRQRLELLGSADRGRNYRSGRGEVRNTNFERFQVGGGYALHLGSHEVGANVRYQRTDDTGTPALPMDIRFFDTLLVSGDYAGRVGDVELDGRLFLTDVDHEMDNFSLRPVGMASRRVEATGLSGGWIGSVSVPLPVGRLAIGSDGLLAEHEQDIFDPTNPAFLVRNFNDARRDLYSGWVEWSGDLVEQVSAVAGVRYTHVRMDTGDVSSPPPLAALRDAFNAADRDRADHNVDAVARLAWQPREEITFEISGGRRTRSPNHIERYSWAPIEVTAGLADGNSYVGDIRLDPEVSHEVSGGFTWNAFGLYVSPRGFYKSVNDYIQGVRLDPMATVRPALLQWTNVDAELFGADADVGVDLPGPLQLDGSISYVRGKRRDTNDNLFRIAPLRGRATLSWRERTWFAAIEGLFAAEQDKVSRENLEDRTHGYAILNLYAGVEPLPGLRIVAGIDNVADEFYRDHLAGLNRVADSSVALDSRIPGPGRSFYARLGLRWGSGDVLAFLTSPTRTAFLDGGRSGRQERGPW